ncbi:MAG: protein-ADP-ribose hydrolase [Butyrivibrio sp.]|nr:protein-ADP-ribose hydrolase [Butyrivibrio sp.]
MQISGRLALAIHILLYVDYFSEKERVTSDALAASTNVNSVIVRKLLLQLRDAGLIRAKRGMGGIRLLVPLSEISMYDVYRAVEAVSRKGLFRVHEQANPLCPVGRNIQFLLGPRFAEAQESMEEELKGCNLEQLQQELRNREEAIPEDGLTFGAETMSQEERRLYLIGELQNEIPEYRRHQIPTDEEGQWRLLRSLFNLRPPYEASWEFLEVQDALLREMTRAKGITEASELEGSPLDPQLVLWQGDITTLHCDAIVNAATAQLLGCFQPLHSCVDNMIHTMSGVQLRIKCNELMQKQGHDEPAGGAKITPAYNLPCRYVIHTVGPVVTTELTKREEEALESCYRACLALAAENECETVAFSCISTGGAFQFPPTKAAKIAVETVKNAMKGYPVIQKVIFNVYSDRDRIIYRRELGFD